MKMNALTIALEGVPALIKLANAGLASQDQIVLRKDEQFNLINSKLSHNL
jgi:hypothetical protein